jgi:hypothetical protein
MCHTPHSGLDKLYALLSSSPSLRNLPPANSSPLPLFALKFLKLDWIDRSSPNTLQHAMLCPTPVKKQS